MKSETDAKTENKIEHNGVTYYQLGSEKQQQKEQDYFLEWKNDLIKFWKNKGNLIEKMRVEKLEIEDYRKEVNRIFYDYGEPEDDPILGDMYKSIKELENDPHLKSVFKGFTQFKEELKNNPIKRAKDTHCRRELNEFYKKKSQKITEVR